MDTQLIIGGAVACMGLGYLLYRYSDDGVSAQAPLARDDVIRILEELRSELLNISMSIYQFVMSIKGQMNGRIPDEYIKEIIMTQTPIGEQISKVEEHIYQKNSITKEMFEKACTKTYADDSEIKELMNEMKKCLDDSFLGNPPRLNIKIPDFMTPDLTLRVFNDMNDATLVAMHDALRDVNAKGIYDIQSQAFQMEMQRQAPKIDMAPHKIFEKYEIDNLDHPANLIIQKAVELYSLTDHNFKTAIGMIQQDASQKLNAMMMGAYNPKEIETIRTRLNAKLKVEVIEDEEEENEKEPLIQELDKPREVKEEDFSSEDLLEGEVIAS